MEFRLNKVDPEVQRRVEKITSTGKVHNKSEIFISKDYKGKKNNNEGNFKSELTKYKQGKNKKRIFVEASKVEKVEVKAFKEEKENLSRDNERGNILDVKK